MMDLPAGYRLTDLTRDERVLWAAASAVVEAIDRLTEAVKSNEEPFKPEFRDYPRVER